MLAPAKLEDGQSVRVGSQQVRYVRRRATGGQPGDLPIIVLHGWGAHIEAVAPILAALDGAPDLIALDLPGFGESEPPGQAWDVDSYARFMIHFLDELGVERAHLVGHSHGGRVSIALAADQPERVGRLLLIDSAGLRPKRGWKYRRRVAVAKLGRLIAKIGRGPGRRLQERMRARVGSRDYLEASEAMRGTFRAVVAADLADRLSRIRASTLLVWGEQDDDTPLWMAHRMEELIPDAGLVVLEGAGHYSYADAPGQFRPVARRFLLEQPRAAAPAKDARGAEEPHAPGEKPRAAGEDPRAAGEEPRAAGEEPRAAGEEPRAAAAAKDARGAEEPHAPGEKPRAAGEEPRAAGEEPRAGGEEPRAGGGAGAPS